MTISNARRDALKALLEERRREVGEVSPTEDSDEDLVLSLTRMKAETLSRIEDALTRLGEDRYGNCFECGEEISEQRLRALPFAIRCKDCEGLREAAERRERTLAQRRPTPLNFEV